MSERLPRLRPEDLDEEQRRVYDAIAGGPRAQGPQLFRLLDDDGGLEGPFNAFLLQPRVGDALQAMGGAIRYATSLSARGRELAILVVAAWWDSDFERYAHEAVGRGVGLTEAELQSVRDKRPEGIGDPMERLITEVCLELCASGDLADETWARAEAALGPAQLFELSTLVGYYALLAMQLRLFRVSAPQP